MQIILLGLFFRIIIATWNGFVGPTFGAQYDALTFHNKAVTYSNTLVFDNYVFEFQGIGLFYSYLLGYFYFLTTDSLFIGCLLSCFVWFLSAILLNKILKLLEFNNLKRKIVLFIYIFFPSVLMLTSVTLREPFQLLFVNLAIYSTLLIFIKKKFVYWFPLLFSFLAMSILHKGLILLSVFILVGIFFFIPNQRQKIFSYTKILFFIPLAVLIAFFGIKIFESYAGYLITENLIDIIVSHKTGILTSDKLAARANYIINPEINGFAGLVRIYPIHLLQYFFEPMPWRVSSFLDLVALSENIFRALLFFMIFNNFLFLKGWKRGPWIFLFLVFICIESIWAMGTINWGTAIRHHVPSFGLLLIIAFASSYKHKSTSNLKNV